MTPPRGMQRRLRMNMKIFCRAKSSFGLTLLIRCVSSTSPRCSSRLTVLDQIETWVIAPYKKPERDLPENAVFNNHVSMVRIRSEHAIGYLKGRFQSLKDLRIQIDTEESHKLATYWILACVVVHNFAMECEAQERADSEDTDDDPFIREGLSSSSSDSDGPAPARLAGGRTLAAARARREELKEALFQAKERRHSGIA